MLILYHDYYYFITDSLKYCNYKYLSIEFGKKNNHPCFSYYSSSFGRGIGLTSYSSPTASLLTIAACAISSCKALSDPCRRLESSIETLLLTKFPKSTYPSVQKAIKGKPERNNGDLK